MPNFWRYVRFGFRLLTKDPGFTAVALLALTLGIGANTAIFSVIYAALLAAMPYPNPNQLSWSGRMSMVTIMASPLEIFSIGNSKTPLIREKLSKPVATLSRFAVHSNLLRRLLPKA
jgi:hypothetical protein